MSVRLQRFILPLAVLLFLSGGYFLLLAAAPSLPNMPVIGVQRPDVAALLRATLPGQKGDWLYIPQLNIALPIATGSDNAVLLHNVWHRQPQNGDPVHGGNFVLSAHRFYMGWTPGQTIEHSPFYHIDDLKAGDTFFVDYQGVRYAYKVSRLYQVRPNAAEIEGPSATPKLTLYSCDLRGSAVGRYVIEALPKGVVNSKS